MIHRDAKVRSYFISMTKSVLGEQHSTLHTSLNPHARDIQRKCKKVYVRYQNGLCSCIEDSSIGRSAQIEAVRAVAHWIERLGMASLGTWNDKKMENKQKG